MKKRYFFGLFLQNNFKYFCNFLNFPNFWIIYSQVLFEIIQICFCFWLNKIQKKYLEKNSDMGRSTEWNCCQRKNSSRNLWFNLFVSKTMGLTFAQYLTNDKQMSKLSTKLFMYMHQKKNIWILFCKTKKIQKLFWHYFDTMKKQS